MILSVPLLLCMDLQQEFVAPGRPFADPDGDEISAVCADLIAQARRAGWTVVHAQLHQGGPVIAGHGLTQPILGVSRDLAKCCCAVRASPPSLTPTWRGSGKLHGRRGLYDRLFRAHVADQHAV